MYPLVCSFACLTGDYSQSECFAETWLRTAGKGAVAVWASSVNSYWDEDDVLETKLFQAIYGEELTTFGEATLRAKQLLPAILGAGGDTRRYFEQYNLFGDPTAMLQGLDLTVATASQLPLAYPQEPYQTTLRAANGSMPYTWSIIAGSLPDGLTLDTATGLISGTPSTVGTSHFTVQVTDAAMNSASQAMDLSVAARLHVTTAATLPLASLDQPYSTVLEAAGGTSPYAWAVASLGAFEETGPTSGYLGGGVAQNWRDDDATWPLALPWAFTFYGEDYTSVNVSSNGFLDFTSGTADSGNSVDGLKSERAASRRFGTTW